jgi:hypothetical protein
VITVPPSYGVPIAVASVVDHDWVCFGAAGCTETLGGPLGTVCR